MTKKNDKPDAEPFNNPFRALQRDGMPRPTPTSTTPAAKPVRAPPARAVIRYERKGHGGKEVTVIERLELDDRDKEAWLKALKKALGCGGHVDGDALVLQGDRRERLRILLEQRGIKKISV